MSVKSQPQQCKDDSASVLDATMINHQSPPPPPWLKKRARAIWAQIWSAGDAAIRLKSSDHSFIGRYCFKSAEYEALAKNAPSPTISAKTAAGHHVDRINPKWQLMLAIATELRQMEQLLGATPAARVALNRQRGHDGSEPNDDQKSTGQPSKDDDPLGWMSRRRAH